MQDSILGSVNKTEKDSRPWEACLLSKRRYGTDSKHHELSKLFAMLEGNKMEKMALTEVMVSWVYKHLQTHQVAASRSIMTPLLSPLPLQHSTGHTGCFLTPGSIIYLQ